MAGPKILNGGQSGAKPRKKKPAAGGKTALLAYLPTCLPTSLSLRATLPKDGDGDGDRDRDA